MVRRPLFDVIILDPDDNYECGAVGGMGVCTGIRSTRRHSALVSLCPPQIPHDLTWPRAQTTAVGSRLLTLLRYGTALVPGKE
jgi:hypothetical protein